MTRNMPQLPERVLALQSPARQSHPPGDLAIWIFIFAELLVFAVFFMAYAWTRRNNVELFDLHQLELDRRAGFINTLALITSSFFVVQAVVAMKAGQARRCSGWLLAALAMGSVFLLVKYVEYAHHFSLGITLRTNTFYMFYLSLTFFHTMHVLMGMIILLVVAVKAWQGRYTTAQHTGVETGASYWHMVDLVWLFLFPLVYIMH